MLNYNFDISPEIGFTAIATVEELANHDMIYIYHHLHVGAELQLIESEPGLHGEIRYAVFYKRFKLGYIKISGALSSFYADRRHITAEVIEMSKEKYLPLKGLDIKLKTSALRKVS